MRMERSIREEEGGEREKREVNRGKKNGEEGRGGEGRKEISEERRAMLS